jgi:hypothetical protein
VAAVLPVAGCAPLCDRELGFSVGIAAHGEPRTESRRPPPLFIAQCDGVPPAMDGLGALDQGADWSVGGDQSNRILSQSLCSFNGNPPLA